MLVAGVSETLTKKPRPQAMNTVGLLKTASKAYGIGPQATMHAAENLYLQVRRNVFACPLCAVTRCRATCLIHALNPLRTRRHTTLSLQFLNSYGTRWAMAQNCVGFICVAGCAGQT